MSKSLNFVGMTMRGVCRVAPQGADLVFRRLHPFNGGDRSRSVGLPLDYAPLFLIRQRSW